MEERPLGDGPAGGEQEAAAKEKERVRLIGSDEAAEALERGDVAPRRGSGTPRYGDRPEAPPDDAPRPTLRFPLARDHEDADVPRPRPTAPTPLPTAASGRATEDETVDDATEVRPRVPEPPQASVAETPVEPDRGPTVPGAAGDVGDGGAPVEPGPAGSSHETAAAEPPVRRRDGAADRPGSAAVGASEDPAADRRDEGGAAAPPEPPPQVEVDPPADDVPQTAGVPTVPAEPSTVAQVSGAGAAAAEEPDTAAEEPAAGEDRPEAAAPDDPLGAWSSLGISGTRWRDWDQGDEEDSARDEGAGARRPPEPPRPAPSGFFRPSMDDPPAVPDPAAAPGADSADADAAVVRPPAWGTTPDTEEADDAELVSAAVDLDAGPEVDDEALVADETRADDERHLRPLDDEPIVHDAEPAPAGRDLGPGDVPPEAPTPARDVRLAVLSGAGLAAVALALFLMGPGAAMVLVGVVILVATAELFSALQRGGYQPATLLGLVSSAGLAAGTYWRGEAALPIVFGLTVIVALLWYLVGVTRLEPTMNAGVTVFASAYVGLLGSFAALMLREPNGRGLLGGVIIAVVANDVGALLAGRKLGRRLIAPHISPNKTIEGLLGGAVGSVVVSALVLGSDVGPFGFAPWSLGTAVAVGLLVGLAAPMGDLSESLIKRDLGIKDMSTIIPGHGGLLDRVDALLFCLPAVYYLAQLLEIG